MIKYKIILLIERCNVLINGILLYNLGVNLIVFF